MARATEVWFTPCSTSRRLGCNTFRLGVTDNLPTRPPVTALLPAGPRAWLAALAIGALGLFRALVLGQLGLVIGLALALAWLAAYVLARRDRLTAVSGLLTGLGLAWMVMVIVAYTEARM